MEETIERIEEYAVVVDPSIEGDSLLDFVIGEVVDRALIYTNRNQLVEDYESEVSDIKPIPTELERPLARVVVASLRTMKENLSGGLEVKSISDNGQAITYGDSVVSYLSSREDTDIFSSIKSVIDKFRIPVIVENT